MSTINPQANGSFLVSVHKNNKRVRRIFKTQHEAELFLAELKVKALKGSPAGILSLASSDTPRTLQELQQCVLKNVWRGMGGEKTSTINSQSAVDFFGPNSTLENELFTRQSMDQYVEHLKKRGNSAGTINVKLSTLNRMISYANERGWLTCMIKGKGIKRSHGRIRYLTPAEEVELITATENLGRKQAETYANLWKFLIDTGARVGEALSLEWKDVSLVCNGAQANEVVFWETKNGEFRTVPLTTRLVDFIRETAEIKLFLGYGEKVFNLRQTTVNYVWQLVKKKNPAWANDGEFVPHALRHTCASRLVQKGIPLYTVMNFLGHKSMSMTMRYSHLSSFNLQEALKALDPKA